MSAPLEPERRLLVKSKRYVHGKVGEVIKLRLSDNQLLSLLQSGAVVEAPPPPPPAVATAPAPAATEGKANG